MADRKKAKPVKEVVELEGGDILSEMLDTGIKPRDEAAKEYGQDRIKNLVEQRLDPGMVTAKGVTRTVTQRIAPTATAPACPERPLASSLRLKHSAATPSNRIPSRPPS